MIGKQVFGTLAILIGIAIIIFALSDLLFRLAIALCGLWLINYGMRLRHQPPLFMWVRRSFYHMNL